MDRTFGTRMVAMVKDSLLYGILSLIKRHMYHIYIYIHIYMVGSSVNNNKDIVISSFWQATPNIHSHR